MAINVTFNSLLRKKAIGILPMDLDKLRKATRDGRTEWRKHVLVRLAERNIKQATVVQIILEGEVIEDYPEDSPFPSCLMFKMIEAKPYHVVVAFDEANGKVYVITTYEPGSDKFETDYRTRRK